MKKLIFLILCSVSSLMLSAAMQSEVSRYCVKDGKNLMLTHYYNVQPDSSRRGCVIFVFGGGFAHGKRDAKQYLTFFEWLCNNGYDVASIDYRLAMSKEYDDRGWKKGALGKLNRFTTAIEWACEDLFDATAYVLSNAERWNVDRARIVCCGSSAGAITCLMAEHGVCNGAVPEVLRKEMGSMASPYAGVISFAGGIFSTHGHPKWEQKPCPLLLFHGNSDSNVPYMKAALFGKGLWGSAYICRDLDEMGCSYYFYDALYEDHSMALRPMNENRDEILEFLNVMVERSCSFQVHKKVRNVSKGKKKTRFSPLVYLSHKY